MQGQKGGRASGEDGPSFNPGRPHELQSNLDPREMVTCRLSGNRTRLIVYPVFFYERVHTSSRFQSRQSTILAHRANKCYQLILVAGARTLQVYFIHLETA